MIWMLFLVVQNIDFFDFFIDFFFLLVLTCPMPFATNLVHGNMHVMAAAVFSARSVPVVCRMVEEGFGKGQGFGKGLGRGGARHFAKPYVDTGLLFKVLEENHHILQNFGSYEHLSKSQGACFKGLIWTLPLWKGLVALEASGEIHSQPLRAALVSLLARKPDLNDSTDHSGQVWANLKLERITCILVHVRNLARGSLTAAAARLNREEFKKLQAALQLVELPNTLEKVSTAKDALEKAPPLNSSLEKEEPGNRRLKKENSDVSMDSRGYPKMFGNSEPPTPSKQGAKGIKPQTAPCIARRRPGQMIPLEKGDLEDALGYDKKMRRPAAALEKASKAQPKKGKKKKQKQPRKAKLLWKKKKGNLGSGLRKQLGRETPELT